MMMPLPDIPPTLPPTGEIPFLSVVVPAYNEEGGIASCLERLSDALPRLVPSWEIVVADDGSQDRTRAIVGEATARDARVRLLALSHHGKGAAVRRGLLEARGGWRFMADADLSMQPETLARFLSLIENGAREEILIGSREAAGGERIGEPLTRYLIGRAFNIVVRALAVPGIRDTQCGFKLFSARAAGIICPHLRTDGFAFDVEMLFLAKRAGLAVREVGIPWHCRQDSRVAVGRGASAFLDVVRLRARARSGQYAAMPSSVLSKPPT